MKDKQLERQAYLDGQLSVDEAIVFETDLDSKAKARVEAEKHFETVLGERLSDHSKCPDELWTRVKTQIVTESQNLRAEDLDLPAETTAKAPSPAPDPKRFNWRVLSLAAVLLLNLALVGLLVKQSAPKPGILPSDFAITTDMKEFAKHAEVPGDYAKMQSALTQNGIHLTLSQPSPKEHHKIEPLGMVSRQVGDKRIAIMYFNCCGQPMTVLLMPKSENVHLDEMPLKNLDDFRVAAKLIDNYRVVVVGQHQPEELLRLFS